MSGGRCRIAAGGRGSPPARGPTAPTSCVVLGVLLSGASLVLFVGCGEPASPTGDPGGPVEPALTDPVRPVPLPAIDGFDAEVQRQLRDAHAGLQAAIEAGTATGEQYGRVGMRFAAYGLIDAAEAAYFNARRLEPSAFRWAYYLSVLYDETSRPEEAIAALEPALALSPGYVAGLVRLGDLLAGQNRTEEAARRYADALTLDPSCHPCLVGLGQVALQQREFQRAADYLERAVDMAPSAATIRYPLALAYRGLGDETRAQAQLQARADATFNTGLGKQIDRPGVYDPLLNELQAVAAAGTVALEARGVIAARAGRWAEAIADFNALVAADPDNAVSRNLLATALLTTGQRDAARRHYEEAIRIDPGHARANLHLGLLLAEDGRETDAIARFRRAVEADPGSNLVYLNLAAALMRNGEAAEAADVYEQLLRLDPSNAPARLGRAFALIRAGRHAEAAVRLGEDMQARPNELAFTHTLTRLLAASPDPDVRDGARALELMQQVSAALQSPEVLETAAMVMAEAGVFERAAEYQRMTIDLAGQTGRSDQLPHLRTMLSRYEAGQPSRTPFRDDDPLFYPAPFRPPGAFDDNAQ